MSQRHAKETLMRTLRDLPQDVNNMHHKSQLVGALSLVAIALPGFEVAGSSLRLQVIFDLFLKRSYVAAPLIMCTSGSEGEGGGSRKYGRGRLEPQLLA